MRHKKGYALLLILLVSVISGCGFHLRGNIKLGSNFKQMYIASDSPYGPITLQLKQILSHSGVELEDKPGPQIITLSLKNERYRTTTFSQSASSKTTQYTLVLDLDYSLTNNKGDILYGPKTISTQANYTVNQDAVLTTSTQEDITRTSLQRQAVYLLLQQLNSPAVANALATKSTASTQVPSSNEN
ncbi:MAG: hypothetical protein K2Q33_02575 [Gammaproteobacteria bacterium]|nr:hypothetical protein [Gammaproteobacteria bacterium]